MRRRIFLLIPIVGLAVLVLSAAPPSSQNGMPIQITSSGPAPLPSSTAGGNAADSPEFDSLLIGDDTDSSGSEDSGGTVVNRTVANGPGAGINVRGGRTAKSNPQLTFSIDGLSFHDQRFANSGNQFSVEPPDQGLCAGNGFLLETVNDVLRIYDSAGNALTGPIDLNSFYGYAPAINRQVPPLRFGPSITDPSCYYDSDTQRWFHVVLTLDRANPFTQRLLGANHLDIAVSTSSDPTGSWVVYKVPVQNDGTQRTPDHNCRARSQGVLVHGPCLGDYPHIGADANGFYITTNEFNLFAPGFRGAQVYALSKKAMAANASTVNGVLFDTTDPSLLQDGLPGFTVWPAETPAALYDSDNGGTEFFMSSTAVFFGIDNRLRVWSLSNTQSLNSTPAVTLSSTVASVIPYAVPGSSFQKAGSIPLQQCVADPTCAPRVGAFVFNNNEARLPSNDSRMQQVIYANGKLWGAVDTGLLVNGTEVENGIAFFVLNPNSLTVFQQGYIGLPNNNVTYPALAVTPGGRGVMAFTLVGGDHYPSAAYVSIDTKIGAGDIQIAAEGAGPQDGFTGYFPLVNPIRPRWGDYGGAVSDGTNIWIASEYIGQTCSYTQYLVNVVGSRFGTCNETRGSLGNWGTRITKLAVGQ